MKRNDLVTVALPGDLGKPRPALVVQSDLYRSTGSVVVLPLTSDITDITQFRTLVTPSAANGLRVESHVMVDKITNVRRDRVGGVIGVVDENIAIDVTRKLAVFLGLG